MRYSIIDGRMRAFEKAFLRGLGYELIEVPKSTRVYPEISSHVDIFAGKILFPFLKSGTVMQFTDGEILLKVVFDQPLVFSNKKTTQENPLYIAKPQETLKTHNRPDILIHVYDVKKEWYLGAIVLQCKYRKLNSFWTENGGRSSIGQLQAYYKKK